MAKILYLSCHSVLEWDEISLLTELGHDVFSPGGAYMNPLLGGDNRRPAIKNAILHEDLFSISMQCSKENLHPKLVEWCDIVLSMHNPKHPMILLEQPWIVGNWPLFKSMNKRVIWRSIGQSIQSIEEELFPYKQQGLEIVRYSPKERNIPSYAGEDAMIRFYKDPEEYKDWNGKEKKVLNFTQSLKVRDKHTGYRIFMEATEGFPRVVYGPGNEDLGDIWGGVVDYEAQKKAYRDARVYFYHGTAPASYVLNLIEPMMTGTPVVATGINSSKDLYGQDTNEITDIIENGRNGFLGDNVDELKGYIKSLMEDEDLARRIGEEGRKTAIALWGKEKIKEEWRLFLEGGNGKKLEV